MVIMFLREAEPEPELNSDFRMSGGQQTNVAVNKCRWMIDQSAITTRVGQYDGMYRLDDIKCLPLNEKLYHLYRETRFTAVS